MAQRNPFVFGVVALVIAGFLVVVVQGALWFYKARNTSASNACMNNIRQLDSALQQWALENGKKDEDTPDVAEILKYIKGAKMPDCPNGGRYMFGKINLAGVRCSIPKDNYFDEQLLYVVDEANKGIAGADILIATDLYRTDTNGLATTEVKYGLRTTTTMAIVSKTGFQTNAVELPMWGAFKIKLTRTNSAL